MSSVLGTIKNSLRLWKSYESGALILGWEELLNKRGSTWRKLPEEVQISVNETNVFALLHDNPSMIKRPLLVVRDATQIDAFLGFKPEQYATIFKL